MDAGTSKRCMPLLLALIVLGVYLSTISPVVYVGDSGEFTAAAFSLGIPHNSGYPLYSLLGKLFCLIPLGNVGFRVNLMSAFFSALTVFLIAHIILRFTGKTLCAAAAAAFLAFSPLFWSQTVSAEVYPLHLFFVALMILLLYQWDKTRDFRWLLLFVFTTGLSFGNHMQTVMLAPPVLYFIISGDKKSLFQPGHFIAIAVFFVLPLLIYLYLPIRTQAGAAIHWGDPDSIPRFLAHVTATAHRGAYVFSTGMSQYLWRFADALRVMGVQYGVLLILCLWGFLGLPSLRWKLFFAGVILFDLVYTVFFNIISFEITAFTLPSGMVLAILLGVGLKGFLDWAGLAKKVGPRFRKGIALALCAIPLVALVSNYGICNQRRNYTAYEHALNIVETVEHGGTLFLDGDNNVFPVAYGRIVEGMGEGVTLFDRHNVIFKWRLDTYPFVFEGSWDELEAAVIKKIIDADAKKGVYFAVLNPYALSVPKGYEAVPHGILRKVMSEGATLEAPGSLWPYYHTESFHGCFNRDYMTREVTAHHFFRHGESLWRQGRVGEGLKRLKAASAIGYNDTSIHSDIGVFLTDRGLFENAREELLKALEFHDNLSGIHNNWGYYYFKKGDYKKAVLSFEKAIRLAPQNYAYYNNLGYALNRLGRKEEASKAFKKSMEVNGKQPEIIKLIRF